MDDITDILNKNVTFHLAQIEIERVRSEINLEEGMRVKPFLLCAKIGILMEVWV